MKKILLFYIVFFLSFSILFIFLFHTPLFAGQNVLFYRGLGLLSLWSLVVSALWVVVKKRGLVKKISSETFVAALVVSASLNLVFFVLFPVTFDRSVTMFLLRSLSKSSSCISTNSLQDSFIKEYVVKQDAVGRRMKEQEAIGFVSENKNCKTLTSKSKGFLNFARSVGWLYGLRTL